MRRKIFGRGKARIRPSHSGASAVVAAPAPPAPDVTVPVAGLLQLVVNSATQITISHSGASDNIGVTSITLERSPNGSSSWTTLTTSAVFPYINSGLLASTAYYYRATVYDAAGNNAVTATVNATTSAAPDVTAPNVTAFVIPATSASLTVAISTFTANDAVGVTGYLVTESASTPSLANPAWSGSAQTQFIFSTAGAKTLYGWARDAAGNISAGASDGCTITLPSVLWEYGFNSAANIANPEGAGGDAEIYAVPGNLTTTTYVASGGWDGGNYLRVVQNDNISQRNGGLFIPIPVEHLASATRALGFICRLGSNFAPPIYGAGNMYKLWWVLVKDALNAEVHSKGLQVNAGNHPTTGTRCLPKLGYGGDLYPALTELGTLYRDGAAEGAYTYDFGMYTDEWLYGEFIQTPNVGIDFKIYRRTSGTPILTLAVLDDLEETRSEIGDYIWALRLSAFINGTEGGPWGYGDASRPAHSANSYIDYARLYFDDAEMGPPAGFVI